MKQYERAVRQTLLHGLRIWRSTEKRFYTFSNEAFPPGSRLAYVFRPGTADSVTLTLLFISLLPASQGALVKSLLTCILILHVGATWLGHNLNLSKIRTLERLASPWASQQELLMAKEASLRKACEATSKLQASVAALKQQQEQYDQLTREKEGLQRKVDQLPVLKQRVAELQRSIASMPRLYTQIAHLQAKRRTMERLRWAIKVLKSETAKADVYSKEYSRLKAARSDMQSTKQALQQMHSGTSKHEASSHQNGSSVYMSPGKTSKQQVSGAAQQAASCTNGHATTNGHAAVPKISKIPPAVLQPLDINIEQVGTHSPVADSKPHNYARRSIDSLPLNAAQQNSTTRQASRKAPANGTHANGQIANGVSADADTSRKGQSKVVPENHAAVHDTTGAYDASHPQAHHVDGVVSSPHEPKEVPFAFEVRGSRPSRSTASSGRQSLVLDTPTGGSHVFGKVFDNETFFTPVLAGDDTSHGEEDCRFTPGPEAAAFAAALSAGTMAIPSRSQASVVSAAHSKAVQDDACYPAVGNGVGLKKTAMPASSCTESYSLL